MYAAPNVNFPGVGAGLPSTFDYVTPTQIGELARRISEDRAAGNDGRLVSLYGDVLYDSFRILSGTLAEGEYDLFSTPKGQQATPLNGGAAAAYRKTLAQTNMTSANQLPGGNEFWAVNMQVYLALSGLLDDTTNPDGSVISPGIESAAVAADAVNATNLMQTLQENISVTFYINGTEFEGGPIGLFPSRFGISGYAANFAYIPGAAGTTIGINETGINNGFGVPRELPIVRHIPPLTQFGVKLRVHSTFTMTRIVNAKVAFEGIRGKSATA